MPLTTRSALGEILRHKFKHLDSLWTALQAENNNIRMRGVDLPDGNRSMALLGDAVLKIVLLDRWFFNCDIPRREGNREMERIWSNRNLCEKGFAVGLHRYINPDPRLKGIVITGMMARKIEALIAAVYIDSKEDLKVARRVMIGLGLITKRKNIKPEVQEQKTEEKPQDKVVVKVEDKTPIDEVANLCDKLPVNKPVADEPIPPPENHEGTEPTGAEQKLVLPETREEETNAGGTKEMPAEMAILSSEKENIKSKASKLRRIKRKV